MLATLGLGAFPRVLEAAEFGTRAPLTAGLETLGGTIGPFKVSM